MPASEWHSQTRRVSGRTIEKAYRLLETEEVEEVSRALSANLLMVLDDVAQDQRAEAVEATSSAIHAINARLARLRVPKSESGIQVTGLKKRGKADHTALWSKGLMQKRRLEVRAILFSERASVAAMEKRLEIAKGA